MASAFAFLDTPSRGVPDRRHSSEQSRMSSLPSSRNGSTTSLSSNKSEPGWLAAMNGVDRSRATSVPQTSRPSSGFSKFFGKLKEKKDDGHTVLTSKHAGAVKNKLAHDPKYKNVRRESGPAQTAGWSPTSLHVPASAQEKRHPHSGPPTLHSPKGSKTDLPVLTRIISGDEADEPDEFEKMREQWRQRKMPTLDSDIVEGEVSGTSTPAQATPKGSEVELPPTEVVERQGVKSIAVVGVNPDEHQARPPRTHTPIGGRWKKDEKGVWKR